MSVFRSQKYIFLLVNACMLFQNASLQVHFLLYLVLFFLNSLARDRMIFSSCMRLSTTVCWSPTLRPSSSVYSLNATRKWLREKWLSPLLTGRRFPKVCFEKHIPDVNKHFPLSQTGVQSEEGGLGWRRFQSAGFSEGYRECGPDQICRENPHDHNRRRSAQIIQ